MVLKASGGVVGILFLILFSKGQADPFYQLEERANSTVLTIPGQHFSSDGAGGVWLNSGISYDDLSDDDKKKPPYKSSFMPESALDANPETDLFSLPIEGFHTSEHPGEDLEFGSSLRQLIESAWQIGHLAATFHSLNLLTTALWLSSSLTASARLSDSRRESEQFGENELMSHSPVSRIVTHGGESDGAREAVVRQKVAAIPVAGPGECCPVFSAALAAVRLVPVVMIRAKGGAEKKYNPDVKQSFCCP